ncbi:hypothetical protein TRIUR3_32950 [Triticum urartu]|uniref:Uncharacterized protein n=1 Tax=Triticum urartu TaxID=4572 RepID=M8A3L7_TRIUA|nr:hypothetical protein TRIUR3_32950 [Triticum urartu]
MRSRAEEKEGASRGVAGHRGSGGRGGSRRRRRCGDEVGVEEEVGDDGDVVTRCSGAAACVDGVGDGRGRGGAPVDATGNRRCRRLGAAPVGLGHVEVVDDVKEAVGQHKQLGKAVGHGHDEVVAALGQTRGMKRGAASYWGERREV